MTSKGPYDGDTVQSIFSSGKQIETVIMALLVDKGLVEYEEKVATYWPEFAQGGKDEITVADVMRHSGGVPWFVNPETVEPGQVKVSEMPCISCVVGIFVCSFGAVILTSLSHAGRVEARRLLCC